MAFSQAEITELEWLLAGADTAEQLAGQYRSRFPGKSLTRCERSDMGAEEPFRRFVALDLYLVDAREHCWRITADPEAATGVVLAWHGRTPA